MSRSGHWQGFDWRRERMVHRLQHMGIHHPLVLQAMASIPRHVFVEEALRSRAYDVVLNGNELGGGSIRIHDPEMQAKAFQALNFTPEAAKERFGFLLEGLSFGTPPHGGIALGLDRLVMLILGCRSIRDVMAFPKNQKAQCPMTDAPNVVDEKQLDELAIKTVDPLLL